MYRTAITPPLTSVKPVFGVLAVTDETADSGRYGFRRLPETFVPDDAGLTFAFKEGRRVHSSLCARRSDAEGGHQDKTAVMKVDRNCLKPSRPCQDEETYALPALTALRSPKSTKMESQSSVPGMCRQPRWHRGTRFSLLAGRVP
jgi:hypothetical protein